MKNADTTKNCNDKIGTILLTEDDLISSILLEEILKKHSYDFINAINGCEAVDLCHNHSEIDLVFMDIKMPVMDGVEATQQIKSFRKNLPIIAVTARALAGDKHKFIEAGFDDYISKPINKEKLLNMANNYLSKENQL